MNSPNNKAIHEQNLVALRALIELADRESDDKWPDRKDVIDALKLASEIENERLMRRLHK